MAHNTVLGLDIGGDSIKAVVAEPVKDKIKLVYGLTKPSAGIRKGIVVSIDDAAKAVGNVLQEIRNFYRPAIKNIFLNIGGTDVRTQLSKGIVAVARANSEIGTDDIARATQASEAINLGPNRMILHTITKEFTVDGISDIKDPLGMIGSRLEVTSFLVDAFTPSVKNLRKCVEITSGSIGGLIYSPLASARAVLTKNQKELGVVMIDIGFGTTGVAVYEEDKLIHAAIYPVGAGHITNDIAVALKIPVTIAEKIKIAYGYAVAKDVPSRETIDLRKVDLNMIGAPSRRFVAEVIESRLEEIFEFVDNDLKAVGFSGKLPAGAVLAGGGAKLPGIVDLAKDRLKITAMVGLPQASSFEVQDQSLLEYVESPDYAAVLGLILLSSDDGNLRVKSSGKARLTRILKNILP
ncbi:MAG: cell division protein FtsA [Parcubacteria group bacterium]